MQAEQRKGSYIYAKDISNERLEAVKRGGGPGQCFISTGRKVKLEGALGRKKQ